MRKTLKLIRTVFSSDETGIALIIVLVLLLLGSLTIMPVLAHLSTALKTGKLYEEKTNELYAADAGVEDGIWRIKYDFMGTDYDAYDFDTTWPYETEDINGIAADVTIQNIWLPTESAPNATLARAIIESEKLVVVGTAGGSPGLPYNVKIDFTPAEGDNLTVESLGVWLPQGFDYEEESCSLHPDILDPPAEHHPDSENITLANGGQTVVWSYTEPYPLFIDFPDVDPAAAIMSLEFSFEYNPPADYPNRLPAAIAWITTGMNVGSLGYANPNDVPISWDVDTRIFKINSEAGDTSIQAYSSKCELRQLGDAISGDYVAIGNSLMTDDAWDMWGIRDNWHESSSFTLTTIPADGDAMKAYLYWAGWRDNDKKVDHFTDTCTDLSTNWNYSSPTAWSVDSNEFKGEYTGGGDDSRILTLNTGQDLTSYTSGSMILSWEQSTDETTVYSDSCNDLDDWDYGSSWEENDNHFVGHSGSGADKYLDLKNGTLDLSPYAGQTITISSDISEWNHLDGDEGLDYAFSSDNGSTWSDYEEIFRDDISGTLHWSETIPGDYLTNGFKVRFKLIDCASDYCYIDNIRITIEFSSSSGLDFAFSGDGGSNWSAYEEAFRGDLGSSSGLYFHPIPSAYQTANFIFRLKLVGGGVSQQVYLDNIKIVNLPPDTSVSFKISNATKEHTENLTAERSYVMFNTLSGSPEGFSYACVRDVTTLVRTYPDVAGEEHHTGNAIYEVGDALADTNSNFSFAGWSLIIIYSSPETAGHYLYLRDTDFTFHTGTGESLDFDNDGTEGGNITDFIVPEPITDKNGEVIEEVAARLTCFVAEGDEKWTGDYVEITGQQSGQTMRLSNDQSPETNVWNGKFPPLGSTWDGVDIDTFEILWDDNILTPGDSMLEVDMVSSQDAWNLVYIIVSIRSETVTGGTSHYMIGGP